MDFSNKTVLITGASRGIGKASALYFAQNGADIGIHYYSHLEEAQKVKEQIQKMGRKGILIKADLRNIQQVEDMFRKAFEKFKQIDILINNAGITEPEAWSKTTPRKWDNMIEINLSGQFLCSQRIIPFFISQKGGCIIFVTSICGKNGGLGAGIHYCAAKAGIIGLTKAYANQLARYKIRVNAVAPAMIDTEMIHWRPSDLMKEVIEKIPLKRLGKPEEVAKAIAFLVSDRANFITGFTLDIDGGLYMD